MTFSRMNVASTVSSGAAGRVLPEGDKGSVRITVQPSIKRTMVLLIANGDAQSARGVVLKPNNLRDLVEYCRNELGWSV